jgi:hypothetical protein
VSRFTAGEWTDVSDQWQVIRLPLDPTPYRTGIKCHNKPFVLTHSLTRCNKPLTYFTTIYRYTEGVHDMSCIGYTGGAGRRQRVAQHA